MVLELGFEAETEPGALLGLGVGLEAAVEPAAETALETVGFGLVTE